MAVAWKLARVHGLLVLEHLGTKELHREKAKKVTSSPMPLVRAEEDRRAGIVAAVGSQVWRDPKLVKLNLG
jgi:hypothetical protein